MIIPENFLANVASRILMTLNVWEVISIAIDKSKIKVFFRKDNMSARIGDYDDSKFMVHRFDEHGKILNSISSHRCHYNK